MDKLILHLNNNQSAAVSRMETSPSDIYIKDFDYPLPAHQIADYPLPERDQSRLLIYRKGEIRESNFSVLANHLEPSSIMVLNNTRVIEARVLFQKQTGGVIEIFCLEPLGPTKTIAASLTQTGSVQWNCLIGGASKWKPGQLLHKEVFLEEQRVVITARYLEKTGDAFGIEFSWTPEEYSFAEILHQAGDIPLPPYIKRKLAATDAERYQTIFAQNEGSVAAPTAALHFTEKVLQDLAAKNIEPAYLSLHVSAGTFKPVKTETVAGHQMHEEQFQVSISTIESLFNAKEIIAVGTTSVRTLESLYWIGIKIKNKLVNTSNDLVLHQWEAYHLNNGNISYSESLYKVMHYMKVEGIDELFCKTSLLIVPGYKFYSAKALITNFHQPQSTLLLLVAAFVGEDWKRVYQYALENDFRFLSYGDSSLLWRKD